MRGQKVTHVSCAYHVVLPLPAPITPQPSFETPTSRSDILHDNSKVCTPTIPGMGTPHPGCGEIQGWLWDKDGCGKTRVPLKKSCFRKECPVCYKDWARREAHRATERLVQGVKLNGYRLKQLRHVVFSPPPEKAEEILEDKEAFKKARRELIKLIKKCGAKGGMIVFHPYRTTEEAELAAKERGYSSPWDMIRELPGEERARYLELSPHWHVNTVGFLEDSRVFFEKTGWVYRILRPLRDEKAIEELVTYEIGHSGLFDDWNLHNVAWFGCMSYNKVVLDEEVIHEEKMYCEHCGSPVHLFGCKEGDIDVEVDCGQYVQRRVVRVYRLNIKPVKHRQGVFVLSGGGG